MRALTQDTWVSAMSTIAETGTTYNERVLAKHLANIINLAGEDPTVARYLDHEGSRILEGS